MSNVLVTGGAGFIGSHLVDRLVEEGHNVVVLDDLSTGSYAHPKAEFYLSHIGTELASNIGNVLREHQTEYVFHLAAQANLRESLVLPYNDALVNIMGTINLLAQCAEFKKVKKFVFASTGGALYSERANRPWDENTNIDPQSPYGLSKSCAEKYITWICQSKQIPYSVLRLANVYGPRQNPLGEAGVVAIFMDKIVKNQTCTIFGSGAQTRDYVFVDDVVDAFMLMMEHYIGIYNVSTGLETSLNRLTGMIFKAMQAEKNVAFGDAIPGEMLYSVLDNEKIKGCGWHPKVGLETGLMLTAEWFKNGRDYSETHISV